MHPTTRPLFLAALLALTSAAPPHDTWLLCLQPDGARGAQLSLRTGMEFPDSDNAVPPERIHAQLRDGAGAVRAVTGWRVDAATRSSVADLGELPRGCCVAWADTEPRVLQMEARKFNDYLLHDGLPQVLHSRIENGEEDQDAVEQYRKCAKVVFAVGDALDGAFDRPTGQLLEIVPLEHPLRLRPRDTLAVRVLFEGRPLAHANLCWDHPGNGQDLAGCTWTDADGKALVPVARAGWMTLRLVHMLRPKAADHEWASYWASLSFALAER